MKKLFSALLICTVIMFTANTGCVKGGGGSTVNPVTAIPDIANFLLQGASAFVTGAASTVSISSSSLGAGTFTVNFNLSGANTMSGATATLTMNGSTGTFQTPALANAGKTDITINSISNSGGSASVTSNNSWSISDSTGLMAGTFISASGTHSSFRATHVNATAAGPSMTLAGVVWEPSLTSITLYDFVYSPAPTVVNFNFYNATASNGSAAYQFNGSPMVNQGAAHGIITITSTSPLLVGTFSYTDMDSSTVSGSFSCPAP